MTISLKHALLIWALLASFSIYLDLGDKLAVRDDAPKSTGSQAKKAQKLPLRIDTTPNNAKVRIMNIQPRYTRNMLLTNGRYDVEVSSPGYKSQRRWIVLSAKKTQHRFSLTKQ